MDYPGQTFLRRLNWIDSLKGLGIILVVCGHILAKGQVTRIIYFFHMPLFFWTSGFVFQPKENRDLIVRLLRGLIIPYFSFLLLVTILDIIQHSLTGHATSLPLSNPFRASLIAIYGGSKLSAAYAVFWFPPCLAVSTLLLNTILRNPVLSPPIRLLIFANFLVISYLLGRYGLPLGLNVVPMAVAIMALGFFSRQYFGTELNINRLTLLTMIALSSVGILTCMPMDMKNGIYGTPISTLVTSIALIMTVAWALKIIPDRIPIIIPVLVEFGRASLVIMFLHQVINVAIGEYVVGIAKVAICLLLPLACFALIERVPKARNILIGRR